MKVSNLTLAYGQNTILKDVNFSLEKHLTILGPNGSGKSTLAKALCGLLEYEGSILLEGQELREINSKKRAQKLAYIPSKMQSFELFSTVKDFVLLGRYPYKQSFKDYSVEDKQIVTHILEELNITTLANYTLHSLSSGQQQLVLIAQALAQQSTLLIFDEPTANLDPKNTLLFVKELKKLRLHHRTILITHDIQLASHLNDPVLFVHEKSTHFYQDDFFKSQTLQEAYGVPFKQSEEVLGLHYD